MKICTACSASYSDETLSFCPVDGTTLTPQKEISLDQVPFANTPGDWSDPDESASDQTNPFTNPEPPPFAPSFSQPPPPGASSLPPANAGKGSNFPVAAGAIGAIVFAGIILFVISSGSRNRDLEVTNTGATRTFTLANGASVRAEPVDPSKMSSANGNRAVVVNGATTANTAPSNKTTASANVAKPVPRSTNLTGIWQGKFNEEATILSITTQNGDSFSGTLSKKGYIIKISGKIDFDKGMVEIKETEVLQTPPNLNWYLGTNEGTLTEDGKQMVGTGRDKNGTYSWSFTKK